MCDLLRKCGWAMKRWNGFAAVVGAAVALSWGATRSEADPLPATFTGSSGTLSASATFTPYGSGDLSVTLANTDAKTSIDNGQVLFAVFFDLTGNTVLNPLSATVPAGSSVLDQASDDTTVVGQHWNYTTSTSGLTNGSIHLTEHQVIRGVGFSFTNTQNPDTGDSGNFASPGIKLDGGSWGIVGPHYSTGDGKPPEVKSSIVFDLSGLPTGAQVSNVRFQWGTGLDESSSVGTNNGPNDTPPVPEPTGVAALLGLGSMGLIGLTWRRRKRAT
jgi:hypothetical protein